jgi:hypothetical protein
MQTVHRINHKLHSLPVRTFDILFSAVNVVAALVDKISSVTNTTYTTISTLVPTMLVLDVIGAFPRPVVKKPMCSSTAMDIHIRWSHIYHEMWKIRDTAPIVTDTIAIAVIRKCEAQNSRHQQHRQSTA